MRSNFLKFSPPNIGDEEIQSVVETLKSGWITTGPKVEQFESEFKDYVKAEDALALGSCTAGLYLALKVLDVGFGDEVITTPLTFAATANVIEHVGATVVLADIDPETRLISPSEIEKKINRKTKAVLPVHYAGQICDMDAIEEIAGDVSIIEDSAHCLPSVYSDGRPVGSRGHLSAFSFYANKNLTTAEGGMLTGPKKKIERARVLSLHGLSKDAWKRFDEKGSWKYDVEVPGYKYNMTDIQASLGIEQLKKVEKHFEVRRTIGQYYLSELSALEAIQCLPFKDGDSFHIFPVEIRRTGTNVSRDDWIAKLKELNIGTSVHYLPIHFFSYYKEKYGWKNEDFPVASQIGENTFTLPMNSTMSMEDAKDVVNAIKMVLG